MGNLRGWSVASSGITKIEIYIDGVFLDDAPYGSSRGDIEQSFQSRTLQVRFLAVIQLFCLCFGAHNKGRIRFNT